MHRRYMTSTHRYSAVFHLDPLPQQQTAPPIETTQHVLAQHYAQLPAAAAAAHNNNNNSLYASVAGGSIASPIPASPMPTTRAHQHHQQHEQQQQYFADVYERASRLRWQRNEDELRQRQQTMQHGAYPVASRYAQPPNAAVYRTRALQQQQAAAATPPRRSHSTNRGSSMAAASEAASARLAPQHYAAYAPPHLDAPPPTSSSVYNSPPYDPAALVQQQQQYVQQHRKQHVPGGGRLVVADAAPPPREMSSSSGDAAAAWKHNWLSWIEQQRRRQHSGVVETNNNKTTTTGGHAVRRARSMSVNPHVNERVAGPTVVPGVIEDMTPVSTISAADDYSGGFEQMPDFDCALGPPEKVSIPERYVDDADSAQEQSQGEINARRRKAEAIRRMLTGSPTINANEQAERDRMLRLTASIAQQAKRKSREVAVAASASESSGEKLSIT